SAIRPSSADTSQIGALPTRATSARYFASSAGMARTRVPSRPFGFAYGDAVAAYQKVNAASDPGKVGFSCLKAVGVTVAGFGGPDLPCYATAPLPGLLT